MLCRDRPGPDQFCIASHKRRRRPILSQPDDLISVYQGENVTEAHLVMNLLLDEGIEAAVSGENEPFSLTITPSDVLVRREDEARARAIIDRYDAEQVARADRPDWKCPACGANVIGAFDDCDACGAPRPGTEEEGE
jgi:hypothetical protein